MTFADEVKRLRVAAGLSQKQLADAFVSCFPLVYLR